MRTSIDRSRMQAAVEQVVPGSRLASVSPLRGGISATMYVLELSNAPVESSKLVLRMPGVWRTSENPFAAQFEHETLGLLHGAGLPVPKPLFLEQYDGVPPEERFFLMEYIEGEPWLDPSDVESYVRTYVRQLVAVHAVDLPANGLDKLRRLKNAWRSRGERLDVALQEGEIRAALESIGPQVSDNAEVLRHADFWPGNVLWRDGRLVAVVDWENACIGDPLADVSICRLDLLWILGWEAMELFTQEYFALTNRCAKLLAYHDLVASLRPANYVPHFASAYPELGRPDITVETLTRDHRAFVSDALRRL